MPRARRPSSRTSRSTSWCWPTSPPAPPPASPCRTTRGLAGRPVAVEHNRRVVPRAEHASVRLNHGDTLEIVTFVGGG
ncbi:MAG: thiamine biosynthesis protein ThiS [Acidobacteria bacterium]|nr:MAG: thiamine biosynthesis protein ThiS [Acidobacteriota bacterium]